jgi:photosystem II stability/assembly factor-like uncharacterized protein
MKRYSLLSVLISVLSLSSALSQTEWFPKVSGTTANLNGIGVVVECRYERTLFVVGDSGAILCSSDNGLTWNHIPSPVNISLRAISFSVRDSGIIVGDSGTILSIKKSGESWVTRQIMLPDSLKTKNLRDVHLIDQSKGGFLIGDSGLIMRSLDRGQTWANFTKNRSKYNLNSFFFQTTALYFIAGDSGTILKSTGSSTWLQKPIPSAISAATSFYDCRFVNDSSGYVVGQNGVILKTVTVGETWGYKNSGITTTLRSIFASREIPFNINDAWVIGDSGVIIKSTDFGSNWMRTESGTTRNLRSVFAIDPNTIIVVGDSGTILTTTHIPEIHGPVFSASPSQLCFGELLNHHSKIGCILITNRGIEPLQITSVVSTTSNFIPQLTEVTIPASGNLEFPVVYTPSSNSTDSALILFSGNFDNSPVTIVASGSGTNIVGSGWISQNPMSTIAQVRDMEYLGSGRLLAVGVMDSILLSTDNGEQWEMKQCSDGLLTHMNALASLSPSVAIAVGDHGTIAKTTDGGNSWASQESRTTNSFADVSFSSITNGFAVSNDQDGSGLIHHTTDGGNTWSTQYASSGACLNAIAALDENTAIAVGMNSILCTDDGGNSWSLNWGMDLDLCAYGPHLYFYDITFQSQNIAFAIGENGAIAMTTDRGLTWSIQGLQTTYPMTLMKIKFVNESKGFIYGVSSWYPGGTISVTNDGGASWSSVLSRYLVGQVCPVDSTHAIAVVRDDNDNSLYKLMKCVDGVPIEEVPVSVPFRRILNISFSNPKHAVAVGNGTIVRTTDGGEHWTQLIRGTLMEYVHEPIIGVQCINDSVITAVSSSGIILRSSDGGTTWISQTSGAASLSSVYFLDNLNGYCAGGNGTILHTSNGGEDWWNQQSPVQVQLNSVIFTNMQNGIVVGQDGTILRTTNGGIDWTPRGSGTSSSLAGLSFYGQDGITVGADGTILYSSDGGNSWEARASNVSVNLNNVSYSSELVATVAGDNGTILRSLDGGLTWNRLTSGTDADLFGVYFTSNDTGTVVGEDGIILRTTTGGTILTGVRTNGIELPREFLLGQNYPNPFNPTTTLQYSLPIECRVNIKIFNLLGQTVATLTDETEAAGNKSIQWNASGFASGVYFYRLNAVSISDPSKSFIQVKKMLLMK